MAPPPPYVSEAAANRIIVVSKDLDTNAFLMTIGFKEEGSGKFSIAVTSDQEKAAAFSKLRDRGIHFSFGREWNPSEVFEDLRDKKLISGTFQEIAWRKPGDWIVYER
jgi:hypothetical protein